MATQSIHRKEFEEVLHFLQKPTSYPHNPQTVQVIQTHISYVTIAPPYVYKLKKPVDLGFLNFSSLEQRRHYCEEEVRLNKRLCTDIYESVLTISRTNGELTFGKGAQVVDYVIKMKQLPERYFLDYLLKHKKVSRYHVDQIIDKLLVFYEAQESDEEVASWGQKEKIKLSTDENFEQLRPFANDLIPQSTFNALQYFTDTFFASNTTLFNRRVAQGYIRDCHGDLRLEHINLSPEGICIYDCIEFNKQFRYIDIANDIAFLAMDFEHKGFPELAHYLSNQISQKLADPELITLLPFYKCYRAVVRGKVAAMKSTEPEVSAESRLAARAESKSYFQLALRYTVEDKAPLLVVIMGRVGTGKSTQARMLAERLGWSRLSSDIIRKKLAGVPLYQRGSTMERRALYSREKSKQTYQTLLHHAKTLLEQNKSVVMDATFSSKQQRDELQTSLCTAASKCFLIEITASEKTIKSRLALREQDDQEVSDARLEDFETLNQRYEAPLAYEKNHIVSISSDGPPEETAFEVLKLLITSTQ